MTVLAQTDELFFTRAGLDRSRIERLVGEALSGADDGELYLEYSQSESLGFDDGRLKAASFDTAQGFGLRSVIGDAAGYAHAADLSEEAIRRAVTTVQAVKAGHGGTLAEGPIGTNRQLYTDANPLSAVPFETKVKLLQDIDAYARAKDPRVRQVSASVAGSWKAVQIIRPDGMRVADIRPLVRLNVQIVVAEGDRMESGSSGAGGRTGYDLYLDPRTWQAQVDEALRQAVVNLGSIPAPAGEMEVVLGPGWPGVMLHEAVGHGLEGDFNRKQTSAFSGKIGQQVASKGVTVVDDGTMEDRRGSLTVDDEGTPSQRTVLIEDGILVGYMQDRQNARLMGMKPTGNGRRQSFAHHPMPRMTNTLMLGGQHDPQEIIASVKGRGLYAVNFGGGQVDITSGKFVFSASEAYLIEDGKIGPAVKGATLIGNGPKAMTQVSMIGNDLKLDDGIGTCGKDGQGVPVGVGQPTVKMRGITVGGTQAA
ncbi:metalloprotease TldD [Oceanibaculum indicum]|uniref:TldD protein n=2 Tax=Oceanibaculum indicum TaxID=526216 RepID=K2JMX9_9PROT|nr:metalloprotease TldD [Oceanibaculum indicum]EKE75812.1 TldD protein [Oceanibaculum indicum P24]RKQ70019.1 TldD protein [Oceanibaculum indicum]